jgi:hypothetical protein
MVATGDFNHDGYKDIALVGGLGWTKAHLAWGAGNGTFTYSDASAPDINAALWRKGAIFLTGNFTGYDSHDLAVISGNTLYILGFTNAGAPVAYQWSLITPQGWPFWSWAQDPRAKLVVGDFNFDGKSDIVILGIPGFTTIPVLFSGGTAAPTFTNKTVANFPGWAATAGVRVQPMEVNLDYKADLVLTGGSGWTTIPMAMSLGDGNFTVTNVSNAEFAGWARNPEVKSLTYPADLH